jgi:hypothetical protein
MINITRKHGVEELALLLGIRFSMSSEQRLIRSALLVRRSERKRDVHYFYNLAMAY